MNNIFHFEIINNNDFYLIEEFEIPTYKFNPKVPFMCIGHKELPKYIPKDIEITFLNLIKPNSSHNIMEWIREDINSRTQRQGYFPINEKDIRLKILNSNKLEIKSWNLLNCSIINVDLDGIDSAELKKLKITIQPHNFISNY